MLLVSCVLGLVECVITWVICLSYIFYCSCVRFGYRSVCVIFVRVLSKRSVSDPVVSGVISDIMPGYGTVVFCYVFEFELLCQPKCPRL